MALQLQQLFRNGAAAPQRPATRKRLRRLYASEQEVKDSLEPPPPSSVCRHLLLGESEDGEMTVVERRVSLKDPVSLQLIECPVRGPNCEHLEAFDRRSYLDFNEMMERNKWCKLTRRWLCPWCQVPARGKDLIVAPEFKQVLDEMRRACSDASYAIVQQDGSLRMPSVAADRRIQTASFKRKSSSRVDQVDTSSDTDSPKSQGESVSLCEVEDLRSPQMWVLCNMQCAGLLGCYYAFSAAADLTR
ncbi:Pias2 [Symbiodinium natans]|uniref:Pias2 protein n=1 Tax=Symbiodinium natans TaxID=878477 RepID=A0A812R999_9DINO|nr:Pias2 [Symbiodinium natans]